MKIISQGFTIIELIIVIVIIGILASITIVSYTGVTQRSNNSAAEQAAHAVANKFERYRSTNGAYPETSIALTADPSEEYYVPSTVALFTLGTTEPSTTLAVKFLKCGTSPNGSQADITIANANYTGARIYHWTYTGTPNADSYVTVGDDISTGVACPAS